MPFGYPRREWLAPATLCCSRPFIQASYWPTRVVLFDATSLGGRRLSCVVEWAEARVAFDQEEALIGMGDLAWM